MTNSHLFLQQKGLREKKIDTRTTQERIDDLYRVFMPVKVSPTKTVLTLKPQSYREIQNDKVKLNHNWK